MATRRAGDGPESKLESLATMLDAATRLVDRLSTEVSFRRLVQAWEAIPATDRPVLAEAIAREADARALSLATEDVTGQSMVPNPSARFYLRVHEREVPRLPLEREEMTIALIRAARVLPLLDLPAVHDSWLAAAADAFAALTDDERAVLQRRLAEAGHALDVASVTSSARKRRAAG